MPLPTLALALTLAVVQAACSTAPVAPAPAPAPSSEAGAVPPAASTTVPMASPAQLLAVRDAVHPGETVYVTTRAASGRACEVRIVDVTRVDDTTLSGSEHVVLDAERFRPFSMALGDIASLEISRPIRGTDGDEDPTWGLSDRLADRVGDRSPLALMVLQPLVVAAQVPYYGIKYSYQAARGGLKSGAAGGPTDALRHAVATCAMPGLGRLEPPKDAG